MIRRIRVTRTHTFEVDVAIPDGWTTAHVEEYVLEFVRKSDANGVVRRDDGVFVYNDDCVSSSYCCVPTQKQIRWVANMLQLREARTARSCE